MAEIDLTTFTNEQLRKLEYEQQLVINRLQRLIYELDAGADAEQQRLLDTQAYLFRIRQQIVENAKTQKAEEAKAPAESVPRSSDPVYRGGGIRYGGATSSSPASSSPTYRGLETTGLEVNVKLQMAHVPTAIYHLLNNEKNPLLECEVSTNSSKKRRLRISSFIEGYSAQAIDTVELKAGEVIPTIKHLPTLFSERVSQVHELTRATLNVLAEDLESGKVEEHQTFPIWLLARNSAPLALENPSTKKWEDLSRYYGAFVTPNQEEVMDFLRGAVDLHSRRKLIGYLDGEPVRPQVATLYEALQQKAEIRYINSIINFNPDPSSRSQRVRLPRESLKQRVANCVDGVLLFASLLEAISLNPAIVIIPGHALVAWEMSEGSNRWDYLETTCISEGKSFEDACKQGTGWAEVNEAQQKLADNAGKKDELWFRRWSLHQLRTEYGITPME